MTTPGKTANPAAWLAAIVAFVALVAVSIAAFVSGRLPEGPVTPVFDKEACAFCKMHVGEPGYAAQLQTRAGDVFFYDDPGCLVEHLAAERPEVHALYFRHVHEERWLTVEQAGFVPMPATPMGFGYGAVDASTPGAITFAEFSAKVAARDRGGQ
ncbi:MAG TPA: hypothetical protein VK081_05075 [Planctomycetota bacterium]|nr:hypothetical protein [Planctomycetota bacterium]